MAILPADGVVADCERHIRAGRVVALVGGRPASDRGANLVDYCKIDLLLSDNTLSHSVPLGAQSADWVYCEATASGRRL